MVIDGEREEMLAWGSGFSLVGRQVDRGLQGGGCLGVTASGTLGQKSNCSPPGDVESISLTS